MQPKVKNMIVIKVFYLKILTDEKEAVSILYSQIQTFSSNCSRNILTCPQY